MSAAATPKICYQSSSSGGIQDGPSFSLVDAADRVSIPAKEAMQALQNQADKLPFDPARYTYRLDYPAPKPDSHPMDLKKAQGWIQSHEEKDQAVAKKVVDHIQYFPFPFFMEKLKEAIQSFNETLLTLPPESREYFLVVPNNENEPIKSNHWATALAIDYLARLPKDIFTALDLRRYAKAHPDEELRVVTIDDAAYTGEQMKQFLIYQLYEISRISVVVPFATSDALEGIHRVLKGRSEDAKCFCAHPIKTIREMGVFDASEMSKFCSKNHSLDCPIEPEKLSLVFFDHKIPDDVSSPYQMVYGTKLRFADNRLWWREITSSKDHPRSFIPSIIPPYKRPKSQ